MIDADGIERPDVADGHSLALHTAKHPYKITEKTYKRRGWLYRAYAAVMRFLAACVLSVIGKLILRVKVKGRRNLKAVRRMGGMIVGNHCHYMDAALIASLVSFRKRVWISALRSNFDIPFCGGIMRALSGLPIPEEIRQLPMFSKAVDDRLSRGDLVAMFPEGSLWPHYRGLRPFKMSAFRFAAKNAKPVIPVTITFKLRTKTNKNGKVKRKYKMTFTVLPPIYPQEGLTVPEATDQLMTTAHRVMKEHIEANSTTY